MDFTTRLLIAFALLVGFMWWTNNPDENEDAQAEQQQEIIQESSRHDEYLDHDEIVTKINNNEHLSRLIGGGIVDLNSNSDRNLDVRIWTPQIVSQSRAREIAEITNQLLIDMLMEQDYNPKEDRIIVYSRVSTRDVDPSPTGEPQVALLGTATYFWMDDRIEWRSGP